MRPKRFVSLGTKLAAFTVGIVFVVSAFVYVELSGRERKSLVRSKVAAGAMVADLFAASLVAPLDFGDTETLETEIRHLRTNPDVVFASVRPVSGPPSEWGHGCALPAADATTGEIVDANCVVV